MKDMNILEVAGGKPIKLWTQGVPVEEEARQQLLNTAKMPFIFKHLAVMPDVHLGKGSTIGSVIPTLGAIIPAAVGVDIGCGMIAARTSLVAADLPDNLHGLRSAIEQAVPHGKTFGRRDRGAPGTRYRRPPTRPGRRSPVASRRSPTSTRGWKDQQPPAPGNPRHRQPLHRGLPGRGRPRLVHAAQRFARGRQRHRQPVHRTGQGGHAPAHRQPAGQGPGLLRGKAAGTSTTTWKRSAGPRISPGRTAR